MMPDLPGAPKGYLVSGNLGGQPRAQGGRVSHEGRVNEVLGPGLFRVSLGEQHVVAHLSGAMRLLTARLIPGDRVVVEVSSYDPSRGRIVQRLDGD